MDRVALKLDTRKLISGTMKWKILLLLFINGVIMGIPTALDSCGGSSAVAGAIGGVLSVIAAVLLCPLSVGLAAYMLKVVREKNGDDYALLFSKFDNFVEIFVAKILTELQIFVGLCLLIVPGVIWGLKYSQLDYVLAENPGIKWQDARAQSAKLMEGRKMELFTLIISFIGWYLLCIITLGIAIIYVAPYFETTLTKYYESLKGETPNQEAVVDVEGEVIEKPEE